MHRITRECRDAVRRLWRQDLADTHLVLVSNRGPLERTEGGAGSRRGQGGLVTALASLTGLVPVTWVSSRLGLEPGVEKDRGRLSDYPARLVSVPIEGERFSAYYDGFSNSLLWFLQHGLTHAPVHPDFDAATWQAWEAYREVNVTFARAIAALLRQDGRQPVVWIHDYHLYLLPGLLRELVPEAVLLHFTHVAWPSVDAWRMLPDAVRRALLGGLLASDIVGFHIPRFAEQFRQAARELAGAIGHPGSPELVWAGRPVHVRAYPISVDPEALCREARGPAVRRLESELVQQGLGSGYTVVQVARVDPSKNLLRSLRALELWFESVPPRAREVRFWGVLPACRLGANLYRDHLAQVQELASRINHRFPGNPVRLSHVHSPERALACLRHYDLLLVNSLADGMNLVAKEGPLVNRRDGVLMLSEAVGAFQELVPGALPVHPFDLVGMVSRMEQAFRMSRRERRARQAWLRARIRANPVQRWVACQLADVAEVMRSRASSEASWFPEEGARDGSNGVGASTRAGRPRGVGPEFP